MDNAEPPLSSSGAAILSHHATAAASRPLGDPADPSGQGDFSSRDVDGPPLGPPSPTVPRSTGLSRPAAEAREATSTRGDHDCRSTGGPGQVRIPTANPGPQP
eukprot:3354191-Pyramimonas_sp.AAC.1